MPTPVKTAPVEDDRTLVDYVVVVGAVTMKIRNGKSKRFIKGSRLRLYEDDDSTQLFLTTKAIVPYEVGKQHALRPIRVVAKAFGADDDPVEVPKTEFQPVPAV